MKILFSVDALSPAGDKAWRLQNNRSWRQCTYAEPLQPGDAELTDREEIAYWPGRKMARDKEKCLVPKEKAGMFDFLMRGIFAHVVIHRFGSAPVPDKAQMTTLLETLTPGTAWLLYLDTAGHFQALDSNKTPIIGNPDIAVRGEIASSPDYVGAKAAADERLVNESYLQFLAGWLEHLKTHQMAIFVPDREKLRDEADYRQEIEQWQGE